jgi:hypothetical protein
MANEDAAKPENKNVNVTLETVQGAVASAIAPEVKVLDRIVQILEGTNKNLRLTWIGIFIAIILFLINMALQYLKIL